LVKGEIQKVNAQNQSIHLSLMIYGRSSAITCHQSAITNEYKK
jgi:hypothetical protein